MTRRKVTLAYIANDSARKATFKKRKRGLLKKVSELSTLCGVDACAIVYSAFDTDPEVWPSAGGAHRAIGRFRNMSEMDQSKRMVNQPAFLRQRIGKGEEQLKKLQRDNREREIAQVMYQALERPELSLEGLSLMDLNDLSWMVDKTVKEIEDRVQLLQKSSLPAPTDNDDNQAAQTHQGSSWNTDQIAADSNADNKYQVHREDAMKGVDNAPAVGVDAVHNQPWYPELVKPSEGFVGFSGFNNDGYNNNIDMVMPSLPPPPAALPPYPWPGQSAAPWSNYFFP